MRFVRLKRLQRSITGYAGVTVPLRAAMSTVKIPRKLYESALQAWSQVVENASDQWRRVRNVGFVCFVPVLKDPQSVVITLSKSSIIQVK